MLLKIAWCGDGEMAQRSRALAALPVPEEAAHNHLQHQLQEIHASWPITVSSMYTHTYK